jgi:hypothetical protein
MLNMFCPNCRTEYRDGFAVCADCGAALVAKLPPDENEQSELVAIYQTHDLSEAVIAKSILDEAGVPYAAKGEMPKELLAIGPIEILVNSDDADLARKLLQDLSEDRPAENLIDPPPDDDDEY